MFMGFPRTSPLTAPAFSIPSHPIGLSPHRSGNVEQAVPGDGGTYGVGGAGEPDPASAIAAGDQGGGRRSVSRT